MAIGITKKPEGIYPAYNDAFVELNSSVEGGYKLEVKTYPSELFPKNFEVFPDLEGNYLFNLKEVLKVVFNQIGFDSKELEEGVFYGVLKGSYLSQVFDFIIHYKDSSGVLGTETRTESFEFYKGVKQVGERVFENECQLLSYSENGIDHDLTYFEGFPFVFALKKVSEFDSIVLKNLNSNYVTEEIIVEGDGSFKFVVDDGLSNWTNKGFVPLNTGLNKIELFKNGVFAANVNIDKKRKSKGVCLRWFNGDGEFSYYVFDGFYREGLRSNNLGRIYGSEFENIGTSTGNSRSKGRETTKEKIVKANFESKEYGLIQSVLLSPKVQMYTSEEAFVKGRFIDVDVDGRILYRNKKAKNEIVLTIDLIKQTNIIL